VKLTIVDDCTQVLQEKMNDVWYRVYTCIHTHVGIFVFLETIENLIYLYKIEPWLLSTMDKFINVHTYMKCVCAVSRVYLRRCVHSKSELIIVKT
jgi:hypothetical protein